MKRMFCLLLGIAVLAAWVGCSQAPDEAANTASPTEGSKYLLSAEPAGAENIIAARASAEDNEEVVVVGRIGGSQSPWVGGVAAFSIVDKSLKACSDIPGDECPVPWDYCCETDKLPKATALVKVVDESGQVIKSDARELLNVKELDTVVVRGKAKRDDAGNLTILATGIHRRK